MTDAQATALAQKIGVRGIEGLYQYWTDANGDAGLLRREYQLPDWQTVGRGLYRAGVLTYAEGRYLDGFSD